MKWIVDGILFKSSINASPEAGVENNVLLSWQTVMVVFNMVEAFMRWSIVTDLYRKGK